MSGSAEGLTIGVSHVGLTVPDLNSSVRFFTSLGFKEVGGDKSYPSVFLLDSKVMVTIWQAKSENPASFDRTKNIGLHHLALKVPTLDALEKIHGVVESIQGVKVEFSPQKLEGTGLTHMMCYEPGGNRIEFTYHAN